MSDRVLNVLFLCTGNSARSVLAEAILNRIGAGKFKAFTLPFERLDQMTIGARLREWQFGPKLAGMSTFERYLSLWVALCIVVGIALGHVVPRVFASISAAEVARVNLPVAILFSI